MIAVVNKSTVCTDAEVSLWTRGCDEQIRRHFAPAWGIPAEPVVFVPAGSSLPDGVGAIYVLDDADQQGVLGWHAYDGRGLPYGRVFAKTSKHYGASVPSVLSHEVCEWAADPHCDRWSNGYALEVCDAVEADTYRIGVPGTAAMSEDGDELSRRAGPARYVTVSNFNLPSWWKPGAPGPYDRMHLCAAPLQLRPGGYAVTTSGTIYAAGYPEWRKLTKVADGARTLKRALATGELVEVDGRLEARSAA